MLEEEEEEEEETPVLWQKARDYCFQGEWVTGGSFQQYETEKMEDAFSSVFSYVYSTSLDDDLLLCIYM